MNHGPDKPSTSMTLLERAKQKDSSAWQRLVQLYGPLVFHWARIAGLSPEQSADTVQDVWISVSASIERFQKDDSSGSFRAWLWTITRNKIRDYFRKMAIEPHPAGGTDARRLMESIPFSDLPHSEPADVDGVINNQLLHRALELIRSDFEDRTWQAFWQITVDCQSAGVVAERLGMTANAVHQARFRVLRRLRDELEGLVDPIA